MRLAIMGVAAEINSVFAGGVVHDPNAVGRFAAE
jgi:hypothetical protein